MDAKEAYIYASWCHKNGIIIFPVPVATGRYKITVSIKGEPKQGDVIYKDEAENGIPAVFDKINELYKTFYEKKNKQEPVNQ